MDNIKTGELIKRLRNEQRMTQKQLADKLCLSDRTVSKWERGKGCPDVSLLPQLSKLFGVNIDKILEGKVESETFVNGNMKKSKFYICPCCGNVTVCTGNAAVSCCGRRLFPQTPIKASEDETLEVTKVEDEWYITSLHPMTKEDYISFIAFLTGDKLQIIKQYPEWQMQIRLPIREHGTLLWYSAKAGLLYKYI